MSVRAASAKLLCGCANLTEADFAALVASHPAADLDTLLDASGAGRQCMACMLDLEYCFTALPRDAAATKRLAAGRASAPASFKQRLYRLLDRVPVQLPRSVTQVMPLFHGASVEQFLWIVNQPMLFDGPGADQPFDIRYCVRDASGSVVRRDRRKLEPGGCLRVNLSRFFAPTKELAIGSVAVDRFAAHPTVRGTTRPQTEILFPRSAASLHLQGAGYGQDHDFRTAWRPDVEQYMFTIVNAGRKPFDVAFTYHVDGDDRTEPLGADDRIVPPYGAALHEVTLPDAAATMLKDKLLRIHWRSRGYGKLHFVCMTRDGERLSIDHL